MKTQWRLCFPHLMIWLFCLNLGFIFTLVNCENSSQSTAPTPATSGHTLPKTTLPVTEASKVPASKGNLPDCKKSDIIYQYTECDISDGRWRVGVPRETNSCKLKNPPMPVRGKGCKFSCNTGQYLDIESQMCKPCPAGQYSLNGGLRFTSWEKIPTGFETWGRDPDDVGTDVDSEANGCKNYKWTAKGQYVESAGDYCKSVLVYSATLTKAGNVSFTFRSNNEMAYFHIKVVNNWCSTSKKGMHHFRPTLSSSWKSAFIRLQPGRNVIFFEAAYLYDDEYSTSSDSFPPSDEEEAETTKAPDSRHKYQTSSERSIQIRMIEITGLSYTSECTPCPAGTYSKEGSAICNDCDFNSFSKKGDETCTKCADDQYADRGADGCKKRPACTERDYYENWSACDTNGMTKKTYNWIKPRICNSALKGSISLPSKTDTRKCPPCNPGQFKNSSGCFFCPKGTFSDGLADHCKPCPVYTSPQVGLYFIWWQSANSHYLHPYCLAREERSCVTDEGWVAENNHLSSGVGHADDAELILYIEIPKFSAPKSLFTLEFEMVCEGKCRFLIEEYDKEMGFRPIRTWFGKTEKKKFVYNIQTTEYRRYKMTFEKPYVSDGQTFKYSNDKILIYVLNITNAVNGGADRCTTCVLGTNQKGCVQCKAGQFLDNSQKKCIPCPKNTYWSGETAKGSSACVPCPAGSISTPGSTHCYSNCKLRNENGKMFDFSPLSGALGMHGEKQFTSRAFPYFHNFNVSVCGGPLGASCFGIQKNKAENGDKVVVAVQSSVCRSYCYSEDKGKLCAQAMSLGERLETIRFGDPFYANQSAGVTPVGTADEVNDTLSADVNFFFKSTTITPRCPNGFSTLITMRCDLSAKDKGYLRPPRRCSHGTCNGCLFHLFWHSPFSCPICTYRDYRNITSACKDGKSTAHHIWNFPKMCRDGVSLPEDTSRECSIFEKSILDFKIFILIFLGLGMLLFFTVLFLCYRNRRLNYKYHRLIDATAVRDGELPAAEKCTLEEGEDDEEEVVLSRNGRAGRRILDRLKKSIGSPRNRDDFSEFETINLTEHPQHRLIDDDDDN